MTDLVQRARELALRAHASQRDKLGHPYVYHLERVANAVAGDPEAEAVAWLHDLEEDQPDHAPELEQFPEPIQRAVHLLTRTRDIDPATYYARIRADRLALKVKLADIQDNEDESRLSMLDQSTAARLRVKYAKARASLL